MSLRRRPTVLDKIVQASRGGVRGAALGFDELPGGRGARLLEICSSQEGVLGRRVDSFGLVVDERVGGAGLG